MSCFIMSDQAHAAEVFPDYKTARAALKSRSNTK